MNKVKKERNTGSGGDNQDEKKPPKLGGIFQERLEDYKANHGTGQKDIAKLVGVQEGVVSEWFNGKKAPSAETLIKLRNALGVSVDYLLGLESVETPDIETRAINNKTGLSPESLERLSELSSKARGSATKEADEIAGLGIELVNDLICSNEFLSLALAYGKFKSNKFPASVLVCNENGEPLDIIRGDIAELLFNQAIGRFLNESREFEQ